MGKVKAIIILVLIAGAFGAGIYFKDDAVRVYNNLNKGVQDLRTVDLGQIVSEVQKQIIMPSPLNVGGVGEGADLFQSKIISETNLQRQQNGNLPPLKENARLNSAASAKAQDMFLRQYFEHESPTGVGPGELVQTHGYDYIVAGENLILGNFSSEKEAVQSWMDSPGHRANILNTRYTEIGVAVIKGIYNGETVWIGVQEFGQPMSLCAKPDENMKSNIDSARSQIDLMALQIEEKRKEIENKPSNSSVYRQMVDDYNQLVAQYNALAQQLKGLINVYNAQVNAFNNCVAGQ